jgi:hypothetical protein
MGPQYHVAQQVLDAMQALDPEELSSLRMYIRDKNTNFAGEITGETDINQDLLWPKGL